MQKFVIFFIGLACFLTLSTANAQTLFGSTPNMSSTGSGSGKQQQSGPKVLSSQEFKDAVTALHKQRMDELTEKFNQQVAEKSRTNPPPSAPTGPPGSPSPSGSSSPPAGSPEQGTGQGWNVRY